MLPDAILRHFPTNCTNWYLVPGKNSPIPKPGYSGSFTINEPAYLGWFTIEEHMRLSRVNPELCRCAKEIGLPFDDPNLHEISAETVVLFTQTCLPLALPPISTPPVLDTKKWIDYIGYRVAWMLLTAAQLECGIWLDYD